MVKLPTSPVRAPRNAKPRPETTIDVDGLTFSIVRSSRRRTIEITVERSGDLTISTPMDVPETVIQGFISERLLWIYTKLAEKERLQRGVQSKKFVDGEGFLYLGRSYRLKLVDDQLADLRLSAGRFCLRRLSARRGREIFIGWYTRHAEAWLDSKVREYALRMGVEVKSVTVQDLGYRWGSCSPSGNLLFHWKTILLPPRIGEYLVVHELAHRLIPSHSTQFWLQVEKCMPDFHHKRLWLEENGTNAEIL